MLNKLLFVTLFVIFLLNSHEASSAFLGVEEKVHKIADINIKGPNGEKLFLAYKTSGKAFLVPYWISDDGYVFGVDGDPAKYIKFPDASEIARLQIDKLLPNPLPVYQLSMMDIFFWRYMT